MKKLAEIPAGKKGKIARLNGDTHFLSRITSIGLTIGCPVEVLRNEKRQPVLLYGRDTMIALSRAESERVLVEVTA